MLAEEKKSIIKFKLYVFVFIYMVGEKNFPDNYEWDTAI